MPGPRGPGAVRRFMLARMARLSYPGGQAEQLLLAPQELRTADPDFANEFYSGHFGLAGRLAELTPESPFDIVPPSDAWARELHGFAWLRHLRAADSELSQEQAKVLVRDWIQTHRSIRGIAWQPDVVARRVISWLSNSVIVLDTSDQRSYEMFLRSLTAQLRYLSASYRDVTDGVPRLLTLMALVYAGLCVAEQQAVVDRFVKPFGKELDRQVLSDGGHISRNPAALIEILLDLLPFRQCFVARDKLPPKPISDAVDRIMPMLRFFRMGDGNFTRFNGCRATPTDALATVLAYDDVEGTPLRAAPSSGYARIERGPTLLIADLAGAPAGSLSMSAHAGCLSFEMSSGAFPLVVNCGAPAQGFEDWLPFARSTAAHSTLTLQDSSSGEFVGTANDADMVAEALLTGPANVQSSLRDSETAQGDSKQEDYGERVKGSHAGYLSRFGVLHGRQILVSPSGLLIEGEDKLSAPRGLRGSVLLDGGHFAVRFHLHPSVSARAEPDDKGVSLMLPNREVWTLSSNTPTTEIQDSVFLADARGPQQSLQVVLSGPMVDESELRIVWRLERTAESGGPGLVDPDDPHQAA